MRIVLAVLAAGMLGVYGYFRFWPQWEDLTSFFPETSTSWVLLLNVVFMVILTVAFVALVCILVATIWRHLHDRSPAQGVRRSKRGTMHANPLVQRDVPSSKTGESKEAPGSRSTPPLLDGEDANASSTGSIGFFSEKCAAMLRYARESAPRNHSQLYDVGTASLTPAMDSAIDAVYDRFLDGAWASRCFGGARGRLSCASM